ILVNVILIAVLSAIALAGFAGEPQAGIWLAWGVAAAGVAQLVMLVVAARRVGFGIGLGRPVWSPGMKRLVTLGIPGVIAGGVTQINIFIGTIIASMAAGAVSYLYFADRIYQLPLGVIGIALGVVLLPDLARRLKAGDDDGANASLNRSLEYGMLLTLPAAVALALVPEPIISVLFERGRFDADARIATAAALQVFAIGLPAFVLIKVFSPGFFAREDTVTPMRFAAIGVVVNIAGSLALFPVIGHVGIAVATTLSGWINALLLGATLLRRGHWARDPVLLRRLPRMLLATVAMGVVLMGVAFVLADWMAPERLLLEKVVALGVLVGAGISVFFGLAQLTGGADLRQLAGLFRRRGA
ncbi:MAG: murein biosynthesis integral membrane protein MurJ, partial [Pseudomonadota bacterium]